MGRNRWPEKLLKPIYFNVLRRRSACLKIRFLTECWFEPDRGYHFARMLAAQRVEQSAPKAIQPYDLHPV